MAKLIAWLSGKPYTATKEIDIEARKAAQNLVIRCVKKGRKLYIYINNRLEGSAPRFIVIVIDLDDFEPRPLLLYGIRLFRNTGYSGACPKSPAATRIFGEPFGSEMPWKRGRGLRSSGASSAG